MTKAKLHKPHGSNRYCGPTALSVLTGLSTDDAAAVVRLVCPEKARGVRGMHDSQMMKAIAKLGGMSTFVGVRSATGPRQTLQQWLDSRHDNLRKRPLIVSAGDHYMVVRGDLVLCNHTKGEPVHILSHPFAKKHFQSALLPTLPDKVVLPKEIAAERKFQKRERTSKQAARPVAHRLAARLHLEFEKDDMFIITSMAGGERAVAFWAEIMAKAGEDFDAKNPDDVRDTFYNEVLGGDSYGHDWREALHVCERVAHYVKQHTGVDVTGARGVIG